ncbi:MAG: PEP-CTERM sorting domain-containing protein [Acidobacteria bacterium]|nr:PEP-CTERM sorting domain-containing protein [Acidobacteriota bacterium]
MKRKIGNFFLLAVSAMACHATPIASLVNTGVGAAGNGLVDPNWEVRQGANAFVSAYRTTSPGFPFGSWMANTLVSMWVSPRSSYPGSGSDGGGLWEFRTEFDLSDFLLSTVTIQFRVATDNRFDGYRVNSGPVVVPGAHASFTTFSPWYTVTPSGLLPGANTLTILVYNVPQATGNPAGLRVEFNAQGTEVPEPSTGLLLGFAVAGLAVFRRWR